LLTRKRGENKSDPRISSTAEGPLIWDKSKFKSITDGFFVEMLEEENLKSAIKGTCPTAWWVNDSILLLRNNA